MIDGDLFNLTGGDLFDTASQLPDRVWRNDLDRFLAKLSIARKHSLFEVSTFLEKTIEDLGV